MSLLTDAELQAIFQEHHNVLAAPGTVMFDDWRRIIAAQQTVTLKAVAEWLDSVSVHIEDFSFDHGLEKGIELLHEGKMPGDE